MFLLNFGAPALEELSVLVFPSTTLWVSFLGVAAVRGEGRLLS
jgi:hypothetical protein